MRSRRPFLCLGGGGSRAQRHPIAPATWVHAQCWIPFGDHPLLLGGTIRHPAIRNVVAQAAVRQGVAASNAVEAKQSRYPPRGGKCVLACAMETWGNANKGLDNLLADLAVMASQKQRD